MLNKGKSKCTKKKDKNQCMLQIRYWSPFLWFDLLLLNVLWKNAHNTPMNHD